MPQHRPRKRFGQHFLHDPQVIDRIISAIAPVHGQSMIEIGPGAGALTIPLLQSLGELHVLELDRDLAASLVQRCKGQGILHMHCQDALRFDFANFTGCKGPLRIAGNLPYNISTPLLFHLLKAAHRIKDMLFMLQEEVVDRMCAVPGNKTYGRLSVMVQSVCRVEKLFTVGTGAFSPPPEVDSAIIKITPRPRSGILDQNMFATIVRKSFSQRRKTLRNALKGLAAAHELEIISIDPALRPEQLTVEQFVRLSNSVKRHS